VNRLKPDLRGAGIDIDSHRQGKKMSRYFLLERVVKVPQADSKKQADSKHDGNSSLLSALETPTEKAFQDLADRAARADSKFPAYSGVGFEVGDRTLLTRRGVDRASGEELTAEWEVTAVVGDRARVSSELGNRIYPLYWLVVLQKAIA
jgi:hypothetical protein